MVRLVTALLALGTFVVPASAVDATVHGDDAASVEVVVDSRTATTPMARADVVPPDGDERSIDAPTTDDDLLHPDLEPHDGPPPLRGPPSI